MSSRFLSRVIFAIALACCTRSMPVAAQELPPSSPSEVELFDYTTVEGDTCAGISQRFFGNRRRYDLIHAYNPNMGPPPHDLVPGTVLHLPRRATPASELADATVTGVERRVEARPRPADEAWIAAQRGLGLYRGGRVATQQRSAAELTFRDTSVVQLREETLVIIFGPTATTTRTAGMEATLETGALRTRLGELRGEASGGNTLRVVTPSSTATLQGGSAVVGIDAQGTSRLSNHSSAARLQGQGGGRPITLPTDTGSIVHRGARPTPPRPLPPVPTWIAGPTRFAGVAGLGGSVTGSWAAVPGASRYRIEIARRPDGREVVFATEVPASVTRFEAHRLPAGTYHVTIATLDADLLESRPSSPLAMEIVEGRLLAPGEDASAPAPTFDPGDPTVEPSGEVHVLAGSIYVPPPGVRCGEDDRVSLRTEQAIACHADGGSDVVTPPAFVVHGITTSMEGSEIPSIPLVRGAPGRAVLTPTLDASLPDDLTLIGSDGVSVDDVVREGDHFVVSLTAALGAPMPAALRWVRRSGLDQVIGTVAVTLTDPVVEETPAPLPVVEPPRQPRLTEAYARSSVVSALALTDVDRRGSTVGLAVTEIAPAPRAYERTERTRVAVSADLSLFDDALELGTLIPVDVAGRATGTWEAGSLDVYAHARWVPLRRDPSAEDSLALAIDLGAWFPTHPEGLTRFDRSGLPLVRLTPSIEVAYALRRVASFRTRQGAILDLDDTGARLWASAYGVDLNVWGPLGVGVEVDLVLGTEIEASLFGVGLSPQLSIDFSPLVLGLGMRFGLNRDGQALFGAASVALSGSVAF
ncbi:MAG: hypothetical protein K1X94_22880 [Sandaracinaceae bacterium]|nr:hypothetical protein [Sandaracinaceae bacterium]